MLHNNGAFIVLQPLHDPFCVFHIVCTQKTFPTFDTHASHLRLTATTNKQTNKQNKTTPSGIPLRTHTCRPLDRGQNSTRWTSLRKALGIVSGSVVRRRRREKPAGSKRAHIVPVAEWPNNDPLRFSQAAKNAPRLARRGIRPDVLGIL